jgi:hypothetical protein
VGEKHPSHAPTAQHSAADQEAGEPAIISAVFVLVLLVLVFVLCPAPLAEQVGEHQAPQPPAPQHAANN